MRLPSEPVRHIFLQALRNVVGPGVVLGLAACSSKSGPVTLPARDKPGAVLSVKELAQKNFCDGDQWQSIGPLSPAKQAEVLYYSPAPNRASESPLRYAPSAPCPEDRFPDQCGVISRMSSYDLPHLMILSDAVPEVISSPGALKIFLGAIDTPHEAALLASYSNYFFRCGQSEVTAKEGGYLIRALSYPDESCPRSHREATLFITTDGEIQPIEPNSLATEWMNCPSIGRSPAGLLPLVTPPASRSLGAFFAHCAYLEAASVPAFILLARDLRSFGAPSRLIEAALRSAQEEESHALMMEMLATRFGASVPEPVCKETPVNTLPSFALENAVEGCVRESFSALIAAFQATTCQDPSLASMMTQIAEEETRHAQLSWDIAQWIEPLLTAEQREKIFAAQQEAILGLEKNLQIERDEEVYQFAGWPRPAQAGVLLQELRATLWMASSERRHNA